MSGAIGLFSRPPERFHLFSQYEYGNQKTHDSGRRLFADCGRASPFSGAARAFTTDGYYIVPAAHPRRGRYPGRRPLRHLATFAWITTPPSATSSSRPACSPKSARTAPCSPTTPPGSAPSACATSRNSPHDSFSLIGLPHAGGLSQHLLFSVTADRNTDRLSFTQTVPSDATGGAASGSITHHVGTFWEAPTWTASPAPARIT